MEIITYYVKHNVMSIIWCWKIKSENAVVDNKSRWIECYLCFVYI